MNEKTERRKNGRTKERMNEKTEGQGKSGNIKEHRGIEIVQIKDIKGGEYVLSLNETTGKIEPHRVSGLLDMGVKPVYKLTTEGGKTIRTTGNHPYLMRNGLPGNAAGKFFAFRQPEGDIEQQSDNQKQSGHDNNTIIYRQDIQTHDSSTSSIFTANSKNIIPTNISYVKDQNTPLDQPVTLGTIAAAANQPADRLTDNPDKTLSQDPDKAMAVNLAEDNSFVKLNKASWTKVIYLREGDEIAACDGQRILWAKIQSIEHVGYEQVYDIEVEGTHNFVANGIIAHNTHLSGNVGIGTTAPGATLEVYGSLGTAGIIKGTNTASTGWGVYGVASATGAVTNNGGVFTAAGDTGRGVYGSASGSSGSGVYGVANGSSGSGVYGYAGATTGWGGYFGGVGYGLYASRASIGTTASGSKLLVTGAGTTSATSALNVTDSGGTSRLYVRDDGNVGIGTTAPGTELDVSSLSTNTELLRVSYGAWHSGGFGVDASATYYGLKVYQDGTALANFENGGMAIGTSYVNQNAPSMGLIVEGNVGIGTTNPDVALLVSQPAGVIASASTAGMADFQTNKDWAGFYYSGYNASAAYPFTENGNMVLQPRTSAARDIVFATTSTAGVAPLTRMVINRSGNVGIGTTGPFLKFHASGTGALPSTSGAVSAGVGMFEAANEALNIGLDPSSPYGGWIQVQNITASTSRPLLLQPRGGNVGIGTAEPSSIGANYGTLDIRGSSGGGVRLGVTAANHGILWGDANGVFLESNSTQPIKFNPNASTAMTIISGGNVGIGTTAPTGKLHVATSEAVAATNPSIFVNPADGNVGIGTTAPSTAYRLHVTSSTLSGIYSYASAGTGSTRGVMGSSASTTGYGVYGFAGAATGTTYGVFGANTSSDGWGGYFTGGRGVWAQRILAGPLIAEPGTTWEAYVNGDMRVTGQLTKGSGTFLIDHPADPKNKILRHGFVESPDYKNIYDGTVVLDENGEAAVSLPSYFEALNKDYRYQLTTIGGYAPVYIKKEIENNRFVIAGGQAGMKISWQVTGVRQDAFALEHPVVVEEEKGEAGEFSKGKYIHPEAFEKHPELKEGRKVSMVTN